LVCLATLGVLDDKSVDGKIPWSRKDVETLITDCEALLAGPSEAAA